MLNFSVEMPGSISTDPSSNQKDIPLPAASTSPNDVQGMRIPYP